MASFHLTDPNMARKVCKFLAGHGTLRGSYGWPASKWLKLGDALLAAVSQERAALTLKMARATTKHVHISGAHCIRCGAALTNPESVAAGIGPECQAA